MPTIIDGKLVYDCPYCQDSGMATVWNPTIVSFFQVHYLQHGLPKGYWHNDPVAIEAHRMPKFKAPWQASPAPLPTEATVVACSCDYGIKYANQKIGDQPIYKIYDENNWCLYRDGNPADVIQWLIDWEARGIARHEWEPAREAREAQDADDDWGVEEPPPQWTPSVAEYLDEDF